MSELETLTRVIKVAHDYDIRFCVIGLDGAIDFHCSYPGSASPLAGLEAHYRRRPTYMRERVADFAHCHILNGPCWCDGTSLYASEWLFPFYKDYWLRATGPEDIEAWWKVLEAEYAKRFNEREVAYAD
jgi:hypothetical protein